MAMSKRSQDDMPSGLKDVRLLALQKAALHMTLEEAALTVPALLDRARAYMSFLDDGCVGTIQYRLELLDIAQGLGDDGEGDVAGRARALRRYVEEGA